MEYYKDRRTTILSEIFEGELIFEEWKEIPGFEGLYYASSFGRLKRNGRILSQTLSKNNGYCMASLFKENKQYTTVVHILVAKTFIINPENKKEVNHKRGNKTDNRAWMLEWATRSENIKHSYDLLGRKAPFKDKFGKDHSISKSTFQYNLDGILVAQYESQREAAKITGIPHKQINACVKGRQKTAHGFIWRNN